MELHTKNEKGSFLIFHNLSLSLTLFIIKKIFLLIFKYAGELLLLPFHYLFGKDSFSLLTPFGDHILVVLHSYMMLWCTMVACVQVVIVVLALWRHLLLPANQHRRHDLPRCSSAHSAVWIRWSWAFIATSTLSSASSACLAWCLKISVRNSNQ